MPKVKDAVIDLFATALLRTLNELKRSELSSATAREGLMPAAAGGLNSESPYRWIKLSKHCEATGDTPNAVHARRRKRIWTDGVQCRKGPDGNLYINLEEYNRWIESGALGAYEK